MVSKQHVFDLIDRYSHVFTKAIAPEVVAVYWEYLHTKLEATELESSLKQAIIQGKSNPSPEWLVQTARTAHAENQAAYGIISGNKALTAAPEVKMDLTQAHFARTQVLASIWKHQGDTKFYRSMLASNAGLYSSVLDLATGYKVSVSHHDVVEYLHDDSQSLTSKPPQSARTPVAVQTQGPTQNDGLVGASSAESGPDDWVDLDDEPEPSREFEGRTIYLGRRYEITLECLDAQAQKEMLKTPDVGVGEVFTAFDWSPSMFGLGDDWGVRLRSDNGKTKSISPAFLKEVSP